jgi:hypothetical protein
MPGDLTDAINKQQCPLCESTASVNRLDVNAVVLCARCGQFKITRRFVDTVVAHPAPDTDAGELLPYVSAHTRQSWERKEEILLDNSNWKDLALAHKDIPVSRKLLYLLELIARRTTPGKSIVVNDTDVPLLDAIDFDEFKFLVQTQNELGYIERSEISTKSYNVILKAKGWEQIQEATVNGIPGKCFVAMSFAEDLKKPVFDDGIEPAVEIDCKMKAVRIDLVPHNDNIIDKIIAEIRTCQFMVADFTGHKAGVYFEAGFAKGLGREIIWTCREDDFENIHFDIAQFSHIVWKNSSDLRTRLANKIKATIPGAT